ncbi:hypothetical protein [Burkholderia ubonensis]|nr:hypothetical protein [Burkholderia ubonensis]
MLFDRDGELSQLVGDCGGHLRLDSGGGYADVAASVDVYRRCGYGGRS